GILLVRLHLPERSADGFQFPADFADLFLGPTGVSERLLVLRLRLSLLRRVGAGVHTPRFRKCSRIEQAHVSIELRLADLEPLRGGSARDEEDRDDGRCTHGRYPPLVGDAPYRYGHLPSSRSVLDPPRRGCYHTRRSPHSSGG